MWWFLPHFLLRSTGFAVEPVLGLGFDCVAFDRLAEIDDELVAEADRIAAALAAADIAPKVRKHCYTRLVRRERVTADVPVELGSWHALLDEQDLVRGRAADAFAAELTERRKVLRRLVEEPRFGEAVWLSSPQMWSGGLRRYLDGRGQAPDLRRTERQLMAYLQRFHAKNDTTSFFGPIDWGRFGGEAGGPVRAGGTTRREAFLAHWVSLALADAIAADPELKPLLRPTVNAACTLSSDSSGITVPGRDRITLTSRTAAVLRQVTGTATVAEIGEPRVLDRLATAGVVALAPRVPVSAMHPVAWLREWLAALPECAARDRWIGELDALLDVEKRFADVDVDTKRALLTAAEEQFERLTAVAARRSGGELYGDRLLIHEEAAGCASPLVLSDEAAGELAERLEPVLGHFTAHALAAQRALREAGARWIRELAGPDGSVPLAELAGALRGIEPPAPPTQWRDAVLAQLHGREDQREVVLDPAALPYAEASDEMLVTSLDLMLVAQDVDAVRAGAFDLVIGECHDTLLVWGWPLTFHPQRAEVERLGAEALRVARGDQVLANVVPTRRVKIIPFRYPGPSVHLGSVPADDPDAVGIGAVRAKVEDGVPVLFAPGRERFGLYNGELHTFGHRIFGPPRVVPPPAVDAGPHTPRLRLNRVVVQRERWLLAASDLFPGRYQGDDPALLRDLRLAARRWRLPRYLFARAEGDRKPVFVDTTSYFSAQMLHHQLAGRQVVLTEMLPGPGQLWLRGDEGTHCAELRVAAFHHPPGGDG